MTTRELPEPEFHVPDTVAELLARPAPVAEAASVERPATTVEAPKATTTEVPVSAPEGMSTGRKAAIIAVLALVVTVLGAAFRLSFDAISTVGKLAGVEHSIAGLMPITIDVSIIMGTASWVWKHVHRPAHGSRGERAKAVAYPIAVVAAGSLVSIWLNALHAQSHRAGASAHPVLSEPTAMVVSALPAVFLAVSIHLVADLVSDLVRPERSPEPAVSAPIEPVVSAPVSAPVSVERPKVERPVSAPRPAPRAVERPKVERPAAPPVSAKVSTETSAQSGITPAVREWIANQLAKGSPLTGPMVAKKFSVSEPTGRRWLKSVRDEQGEN